jgi:hypothetical protein
MSHVVQTNETTMKDLSCIVKACERLGWQFVEGQQSYAWYGHWADDSPIPDGMFTPERTAELRAASREVRTKAMEKALGKCDHAIKVPGASYEVGIVRKEDGSYSFVWDWWGSGGLVGKMDQREFQAAHKGGRFVQAYNVEVAKKVARIKGYPVKEKTLPNGRVELEVLVNR